MNLAELEEILRNGESSHVEFKTEDINANSLAGEIVAFANHQGGVILMGVDDHGNVTGCKKKNTEEHIINICRNNIKPAILPSIERIMVNDKHVFAVTIEKGETAHATNRGLYFLRVGSTKQVPTQQELLRLFQKRNMIQFDETPVLKASRSSIDTNKVNEYLTNLGQSVLDEENMKSLVRELQNISICVSLEERIYPTLGGLLVFGKNPQKYFPSYTVLCGAYAGNDFTAGVIREKELRGTLPELIEDALLFLKLTIPQKTVMENDVRQKTVYLYPVEALRECIVNAVSHRDYTISGSSVRLFLFEDRLEVRSPGGLPNTLTLETMRYRQFTRNQTIASFLSGAGYMERRGKGILRMLRLCENYGMSCDLALTPDNNEFVVTFSK